MIILRQKKFSYGRMEVAKVKEMVKNGQIKTNQAAIQSLNRKSRATIERKKRGIVKFTVDTVNNPFSVVKTVVENPVESVLTSPVVPGGVLAVPAVNNFKPYRKVADKFSGLVKKIPGFRRVTESKGLNILKNPYEKVKKPRKK
jgi:hypothetical protein